MEILKRIFTITLVAIACGFSAKAISIDDFYQYCSKIQNCTEIKIPKLLLKMGNRHLSTLKIVSIENPDSIDFNSISNGIAKISANKETTAIKDNDDDDDEINHIYIQPDGKKDVQILIASISSKECEFVYLKCNKKYIKKVLNDYK